MDPISYGFIFSVKFSLRQPENVTSAACLSRDINLFLNGSNYRMLFTMKRSNHFIEAKLSAQTSSHIFWTAARKTDKSWERTFSEYLSPFFRHPIGIFRSYPRGSFFFFFEGVCWQFGILIPCAVAYKAVLTICFGFYYGEGCQIEA